MTRLKESLSDTLRRIPDLPARLSSDIRSYTSAIDAKEENIERFKTGYAVVRNSTRYLPLAATNVTQQAQDAKDDDLVRRISLLTHDMNSFLATPTDTVGKRLMDELQRLREASVSRPLPLANALVNLIAHCRAPARQAGAHDGALPRRHFEPDLRHRGSAGRQSGVRTRQAGRAGDLVRTRDPGRDARRARAALDPARRAAEKPAPYGAGGGGAGTAPRSGG